MAGGIPILDTVTKKCKVTQTGAKEFTIILTQGLNRQIRRMCEYLGYDVVTLKRTRIMNVTLKGLKVGQWRHLTQQEMALINDSIADSGKTEERSVDENKHQANTKSKPHAKDKKRDFQQHVKKGRFEAKQADANKPAAANRHHSSNKRSGTLSLKK